MDPSRPFAVYRMLQVPCLPYTLPVAVWWLPFVAINCSFQIVQPHDGRAYRSLGALMAFLWLHHEFFPLA
jgi:hypothetical protein